MRDKDMVECKICGKKFSNKKGLDTHKGVVHPNKFDKGVEKECKQCGKKFNSYPSEGRKFCSLECYNKWNKGKNNPNYKPKITKVCEQCGKEFQVIPARKDRKFCSRECYHKYRRKWDKEKIVKKLKELDEELDKLTISNVRDKIGNGIINACYKQFGSWDEAKREAGLEIYEEPWNKGKTKESSEKIRKWADKLSKVKKKMAEKGKIDNLFKEGYDKRRVETQFKEGHNVPWKKRMTENTLKALFQRPTKLEEKFIKFFKSNHLPFSYCGDGKLVIGGKCPDFYENNGRKLVVEVSSKRFRKKVGDIESEEYEKQRKEHFNKYGFKCLIFWEEDLKNPKKIIGEIKNEL